MSEVEYGIRHRRTGDEPRYVDLAYMAEKLGLSIETVRMYHKRSTRSRREDRKATTWRMPAPDAPPGVSSPGHPRWRQATADAYVAAKQAARRRKEAPTPKQAAGVLTEHTEQIKRGQWRYTRSGMAIDVSGQLRDSGTSGGVRLTGEVVEQLADEAEQGYDLSKLSERERRDLVDEHHDKVVEDSGRLVAPRELPGGPVMVRLSRAEKELAAEAMASVVPTGLGLRYLITDGPRGWSEAMAPDQADEIAAALMQAWREHDQPVYELAVRFAEERERARRTRRGGWAAGWIPGDRTE